jgi:hypothetical protein
MWSKNWRRQTRDSPFLVLQVNANIECTNANTIAFVIHREKLIKPSALTLDRHGGAVIRRHLGLGTGASAVMTIRQVFSYRCFVQFESQPSAPQGIEYNRIACARDMHKFRHKAQAKVRFTCLFLDAIHRTVL